jgi:hypothetical protein
MQPQSFVNFQFIVVFIQHTFKTQTTLHFHFFGKIQDLSGSRT